MPTMSYEDLRAKLNCQQEFTIREEKEIQNGKQIRLDNDCVVDWYTSSRKYVVKGDNKAFVEGILQNDTGPKNRKIFVVYGHDKENLALLENALQRWGLTPIILDRAPTEGETIIEKLETYANDVKYAVVLATPDDEGKARNDSEMRPRVRQNVVLELGMFLTKLGRKRVAILLKNEPNFEKRLILTD
ncbi:MAG: nucleotide-binding protein [Thermoguttaceae bacterium]|nr:nucleotide-binding protein [Thermoguttaceae bacterium]